MPTPTLPHQPTVMGVAPPRPNPCPACGKKAALILNEGGQITEVARGLIAIIEAVAQYMPGSDVRLRLGDTDDYGYVEVTKAGTLPEHTTGVSP